MPFCIRQHVWTLGTSVVDKHTLRYGRGKTEIGIGGYAPVVQCTLVPRRETTGHLAGAAPPAPGGPSPLCVPPFSWERISRTRCDTSVL